jgi:hypothetical protein
MTGESSAARYTANRPSFSFICTMRRSWRRSGRSAGLFLAVGLYLWSFSPFANIATNCSMRFARVSGLFAM